MKHSTTLYDTAPVVVGELYTVAPTVMHDGTRLGYWNCKVLGRVIDGRVWVRQMRITDGQWVDGMQTTIPADALEPLTVQVDLFGDPAGGGL